MDVDDVVGAVFAYLFDFGELLVVLVDVEFDAGVGFVALFREEVYYVDGFAVDGGFSCMEVAVPVFEDAEDGGWIKAVFFVEHFGAADVDFVDVGHVHVGVLAVEVGFCAHDFGFVFVAFDEDAAFMGVGDLGLFVVEGEGEVGLDAGVGFGLPGYLLEDFFAAEYVGTLGVETGAEAQEDGEGGDVECVCHGCCFSQGCYWFPRVVYPRVETLGYY